jgi:hypothetical protein
MCIYNTSVSYFVGVPDFILANIMIFKVAFNEKRHFGYLVDAEKNANTGNANSTVPQSGGNQNDISDNGNDGKYQNDNDNIDNLNNVKLVDTGPWGVGCSLSAITETINQIKEKGQKALQGV